MPRLDPDKLHVSFSSDVKPEELVLPRCYTLTHSDRTGDLFLTIAREYDLSQITGFYTRFMRDEVLGQWQIDGKSSCYLSIHCHVSGGFIFGWASMRDAIFSRELPLALEAIVYGDRVLLRANPHLRKAQIRVSFHSSNSQYDRIEPWGTLSDYRISHWDAS